MARAKKRFGQHFLTNQRLLTRIADALHPAPGETVLEIGPGPGGLTEALTAQGARVAAIEIDRDLVPGLRLRFPEASIVEGDALELDWRTVAGVSSGEPLLVTGNIPYNITSPLLEKALEPPRPDRIVFLVQKEVADRITATPGTSQYGALSIGIQAVARAERLFVVPAGAFHPPPKVDSAVIRLTPLESPLVGDEEIPRFRRLVTGLFGFRRKQILRGLRELTGWTVETLGPLLASMEIAPQWRPEQLSPAQFARLCRALVDVGWQPH